MGLSAKWRGRGIGRQLVAEVLRRAQQLGLEILELEVFASNAPALALYKKFGFVHHGLRPRARKIDGRYDDIILMGKTVEPPSKSQ